MTERGFVRDNRVLTIPPDLRFSDLALELEDAGGLHYDWRVVEQLCVANGLQTTTALSSDDVACALIADWYVQHREVGGERDPAVETVLERLSAEEGRTLSG